MTGYQSKKAAAQDKLAQAEQEPVVERAWFTIAELNAWADKKLAENPHWVMPAEEPERKEALTQPAQDEDVAAFEAALQKQFQRDYAVANATQPPNSLTFNSGTAEWVMRITADRRIEVNENVEVKEAAQKVLDALQHLLKPPQPEQEPVAWIGDARFAKGQFVEGRERRVWWECNTGVGQPLYTAPPKRPWVGLTDDEAQWLYDTCRTPSNLIDMVEAKLKEKNNG